MTESVEHLTFRLTVDELAEQERALGTLRTCAGTVLAASSIAGSFFAAGARRGAVGPWSVLAMVAFALCSGIAVWVLLPHQFVFSFRGEALLGSAETGAGEHPDLVEAYRVAAAWIEPHLHANQARITALAEWMTAGCALLAAEVILWTLDAIG